VNAAVGGKKDMKLIGSRARETHDDFSDWDHVSDSEEDIVAIERESVTWLCWTQAERGRLVIITAVTSDGDMHDFDIAPADLRLPRIGSRQSEEVNNFWVDNFRGLKAIARDYSLLFDMGLERCCGYLRGEVLKREIGTRDVYTFYDYGKHRGSIAVFGRRVADVTGLPYRTWDERVTKVKPLIELFEGMFGSHPEIGRVFDGRLKKAVAANKALLSDAVNRARER
jgi:hypothetical protein